MREASDPVAQAMAARNQILIAMDEEEARRFSRAYGGYAPRHLNWTRVLHLARLEVTTMPAELVTESQIYLARTGAQSIQTLPPNSQYLRAALDLIFPRAVWEEQISGTKPDGTP